VSSKIFSLLLHVWRDTQKDTFQTQMIRIDTAEAVQLKDGNFLLRVTINENKGTLRCLIRHLASGREVYIQSGPKLFAFVQDCLLDTDGKQ
jgi:hypothetical protein